MKIIVVGHGRHGKDYLAETLRDGYGMAFNSSSWIAADKVCRPWMLKLGVQYDNLQNCYDDRHRHRNAWYEAICEYNTPDKSRLCREIFAQSDIYVGMRCRDEFLASRPFADLTIWVEAFDRVQYVDPTCKVLKTDADIIMDNNGTRGELHVRVNRLMYALVQDNSCYGDP